MRLLDAQSRRKGERFTERGSAVRQSQPQSKRCEGAGKAAPQPGQAPLGFKMT